ncbi:hypothetical protein J5X84_28800 [Streptosporangiaceae bacterium NEAU-GS5]|nr:hypothetical protein [Streptosporangiaceae bacterium NEAU-GS5]
MVDHRAGQPPYDRLVIRVHLLLRVAMLVQVAFSVPSAWSRATRPAVLVVTLAVLVASTAVAVWRSYRRGRLGGPVAVAIDVGLAMAALAAGSWLLPPGTDPATDNAFYPYTVGVMAAAGLASRSLVPALVAPIIATTLYVTLTVVSRGASWTLLQNSITYWAFALVGWVQARVYARLFGDLQQARASAIEQERLLTAERERGRYALELHDRVLQTMEFLAAGPWIGDGDVRAHVAREAEWLRGFIRGDDPSTTTELRAALSAVIVQQTAVGMMIASNLAGLGREEPPTTSSMRSREPYTRR